MMVEETVLVEERVGRKFDECQCTGRRTRTSLEDRSEAHHEIATKSSPSEFPELSLEERFVTWLVQNGI